MLVDARARAALWEGDGVRQTLMKSQETEACRQTLSEPAAGITFYQETDVMVMDT